jgi:hypothetical protein
MLCDECDEEVMCGDSLCSNRLVVRERRFYLGVIFGIIL